MRFLTVLVIMSGLIQPSMANIQKALTFIHKGQPVEALDELQTDITRGDREALFYAATTLLFLLEQNVAQAISYLNASAQKEYAPALDTLAGLYLHGEFVAQDHGKALLCYRQAAVLGYGPSQFNCGIMYKNGEKIPQNLEQAFIFLALAARNKADLDDLVNDAAFYRDQVHARLTSHQYQQALITLNQMIK